MFIQFFFQHKNAEPPIEAYKPASVYDENSSVETADLENAIKSSNVSEATLIYELLSKNKVDVPNELRQNLLELVAFYNHADPNQSYEEQTFVEVTTRNSEVRMWKEQGLADQLFDEIEPKTSASYNAIIRGKARHNQSLKAHSLYKEALEQNLLLDVTTFNYVINTAYFLHDNAQTRWEMVCEILQTMNEKRIKPNLQTLHQILFIVSKTGNYNQARGYCLQTLAEFNRLGITPTLGTWYHVLTIFCRDRAPTSHVLYDILEQIEDREWRPQTPSDYYFFSSAMAVSRNHLGDQNAAYRIHKLLHFGGNYHLIGNTHRENVYYRNYLGVILDTEPFDVFMRTYETIVPNISSPEVGILKGILQSIDANGAIEFLPKIWSDMVVLQHSQKTDLITLILNTMAINKPMPEIKSHVGLSQKFAAIVWEIHDLIENHPEWRHKLVSWTGEIISDSMIVLCRANEFDKASSILEICMKRGDLNVQLHYTAVEEFVQLCIAKGQPSIAIQTLKYSVENTGIEENIKLAKLIVTAFTLSEVHLSRVTALVGPDIVNNIHK